MANMAGDHLEACTSGVWSCWVATRPPIDHQIRVSEWNEVGSGDILTATALPAIGICRGGSQRCSRGCRFPISCGSWCGDGLQPRTPSFHSYNFIHQGARIQRGPASPKSEPHDLETERTFDTPRSCQPNVNDGGINHKSESCRASGKL